MYKGLKHIQDDCFDKKEHEGQFIQSWKIVMTTDTRNSGKRIPRSSSLSLLLLSNLRSRGFTLHNGRFDLLHSHRLGWFVNLLLLFGTLLVLIGRIRFGCVTFLLFGCGFGDRLGFFLGSLFRCFSGGLLDGWFGGGRLVGLLALGGWLDRSRLGFGGLFGSLGFEWSRWVWRWEM